MRKTVVFYLLILAFCVQSLLVGDTPKRVKRAKPPTFDANEGSDIFFADVFTEALRGTRSFAKPGRVPNLDGSKPDVPPRPEKTTLEPKLAKLEGKRCLPGMPNNLLATPPLTFHSWEAPVASSLPEKYSVEPFTWRWESTV